MHIPGQGLRAPGTPVLQLANWPKCPPGLEFAPPRDAPSSQPRSLSATPKTPCGGAPSARTSTRAPANEPAMTEARLRTAARNLPLYRHQLPSLLSPDPLPDTTCPPCARHVPGTTIDSPPALTSLVCALVAVPVPYACACQVAAAAAAASASDDEERVANAPGAPSRAPFATAPRGVRLLANRLWRARLTSATGSSPLGLLAIT